ncbi:MAG: MarC family protein [Bacteroidales bacterium]
MLSNFNLLEVTSAFMVLFAIIDITGCLPIIIGLKNRGKGYNPEMAFLWSLLFMLGFLYVGDGILKLFGVDIHSFAVAGSLILFVMAAEMTFGHEIFKNDTPDGQSTMVPLVFPLIAGAGAFTALLSLRAEFHIINIIAAVILNLVIVYIVLKKVNIIERILGKGGVYMLRKFFGIILLAISVKLFVSNIATIVKLFGDAA